MRHQPSDTPALQVSGTDAHTNNHLLLYVPPIQTLFDYGTLISKYYYYKFKSIEIQTTSSDNATRKHSIPMHPGQFYPLYQSSCSMV